MFIPLLQHEPGSTTGNCESTTASRSRLTGASTADAIIKDEPDFVETHCHWVGCDRDLHSQDQLVKVLAPILSIYNSFSPQIFNLIVEFIVL